MKKKLVAMLVSLMLLTSVSVSGCASFKTWWNSADTQATVDKIKTVTGPLLETAQKALDNVQKNYAFWSALVQGALEVAGVKVTQEQMDAAKPYIAAADAALEPLGLAVNGKEVTSTEVATAVISVSNALPALKEKALANPAVAALWQAYLAGQTNVPAPTQ